MPTTTYLKGQAKSQLCDSQVIHTSNVLNCRNRILGSQHHTSQTRWFLRQSAWKIHKLQKNRGNLVSQLKGQFLKSLLPHTLSWQNDIHYARLNCLNSSTYSIPSWISQPTTICNSLHRCDYSKWFHKQLANIAAHLTHTITLLWYLR